MVLKVLGNWSYKPKFGDREMEIVFKRLSARDELEIIEESEDSRISIFIAAIVEIKNPIRLETPEGLRDMTAQDVTEIPELKPLFYELLTEYSSKTAVTEANVKKR